MKQKEKKTFGTASSSLTQIDYDEQNDDAKKKESLTTLLCQKADSKAKKVHQLMTLRINKDDMR